jgi:hypothetical protein
MGSDLQLNHVLAGLRSLAEEVATGGRPELGGGGYKKKGQGPHPRQEEKGGSKDLETKKNY